jgi:hypothetical protein
VGRLNLAIWGSGAVRFSVCPELFCPNQRAPDGQIFPDIPGYTQILADFRLGFVQIALKNGKY